MASAVIRVELCELLRDSSWDLSWDWEKAREAKGEKLRVEFDNFLWGDNVGDGRWHCVMCCRCWYFFGGGIFCVFIILLIVTGVFVSKNSD